MKYIDIHGHVNFPDYADGEGAISRAHDASVGMITVGTDLASSRRAVELAEKHQNMWATVGLHPVEVSRPDLGGQALEVKLLRELAQHPKVVAIGECGLDYFHSAIEEIPRQRDIFIQQIDIANKVDKPLMLHVRNSKNNISAYQDAIAILKEHATVRANFHFFAGTVQDVLDIVVMNNTISFTGVLTFTHDYDEVVRTVPLSHIMSETDCPFVAPVPYRGKQNEPLHVREVVKAIARIRGVGEEVVRNALVNNARDFFGITNP
jgi:TatD DNase family protein